jgi:glycosyltransferase involved in cell wall biosynthesis
MSKTQEIAGSSSSVTDVGDLESPSVAVVITTYNHAHFLGDAIKSVWAQTQPVAEILVVDDGSVDDPAAVVAKYPGVRLIQQPNQGLAAARNTGMRTVCSEKVIFLDADDRLLPIAVAAGRVCFAKAPASGFVYGGHRRIDRDGRLLGESRYDPIGPQAYRDLLKSNRIGMHATVMYDRARLMASGGFDPTLLRCEDYDVFLRMARSFPVASHPEIIAEYRWHGGNMSSDYREMLKWILHVYGREAKRALAQSETADDWRCGQQIWRRYYAEQILDATQANWDRSRSFRLAAKGVIQAMLSCPLVAISRVAQIARHRLERLLPRAVVYRLKRLQGKRPPPPLGSGSFGDLGSIAPISADFGFDRGTPIDRYYIEQFLDRHAADICGRALEIGDDSYCRRFGGTRIKHQDILHVTEGNPRATIVGDLSQPGTLPANAFDCLVLTQMLHLIFDLRAAVIEMHRALKPGGIVLLTVPGISQIDQGAWGDTWFWSLTRTSAFRLFSEVFGVDNVHVEAHGNVFAATAFLQGLAVEEIDTVKLQIDDACYPVTVAVRAQKVRDD